MKFTPPHYPDSTYPVGFLPEDMRAQACWFYYILAQKQKENVGSGPESQTLVVEAGRDHDVLWHDKWYTQQARSVALIYGLDSPEEMFKFWDYVKMEANRLSLPAPSIEYMNPRRFLI